MTTQSYDINFNEFARGTVINDELQSKGVTVSAIRVGGDPNKPGEAMIFDTANPTGEDYDLRTNNLGKVLIISEDNLSHDPDDNAAGGTLRFDFDGEAKVKSLTFLDTEESAWVRFYDDNGNHIRTIDVHGVGNNQQQTVHFNVDGVARMDVILGGSGAIDNLSYDLTTDSRDGIVEGTSGNDRIDVNYTGDPDGDRVDANDQILPGEGKDDDIIKAGDGNDVILSGNGDDDIYGGKGNEEIWAGSGNDHIRGEDGNDWMHGQSGDDVLEGGDGDDMLFGEADNDVLSGGDGRDMLDGGSGNDRIEGGKGVDTIKGGSGDDIITGYDAVSITNGDLTAKTDDGSADIIDGGTGNDTIVGGKGADDIKGGNDADTIIGGTDGDTVDGGSGGHDNDTLDLRDVGPFRLTNLRPDSNGNGQDGTVELLNNDGSVKETFTFTEIENILGDPVVPDMEPPVVDEDCLVAEYLFNDDNQGLPTGDRTYQDTATQLDGVAQTGTTIGSANTINADDVLDTDGHDDAMLIAADDNFQIGKGAVSLEFNQDNHIGSSNDTLISRDSSGLDDGGHLTITVSQDGKVVVRHQTEATSKYYDTPQHFFSEGDDVRVFYQWDEDGVDGRFIVQNLSTGQEYSEDISDKLTIDMGDNFNEPWTVGAGQVVSGNNQANNLTEFFDGQIDNIKIYDFGPKSLLDGVVDGTNGNDLIDVAYDGDPEGDRIDSDDEIIPGEGADDDIVWAGSGNDTVISGEGDDEVYGQGGDDDLNAGAGNDLVSGGGGNDTIDAGTGDDQVLGGSGHDDIDGGEGNDAIMGGSGNDSIVGGDGADSISGQGGNDVIDGGDGDDMIVGGSGKDKIAGGDGDDMILGDGEEGIGPNSADNLIVNGSFEDLTGLQNNGSHFTGTDGTIPGWSDPSGNVIDVHVDSRLGIAPADGNAWLDTEGTPELSRVGQDVAGVEDGQKYILSFSAADARVKDLGLDPGQGTQNEFNVIWNGEIVATINPSHLDGMQEYTFIVEGGSGDGSNRLEFEGLGAADNIGAAIDNVSLVDVDSDMRDIDDTIDGGQGNDTIFGQGGDDTIDGGSGDDTISGGKGDDELVGNVGDDCIDGDDGNDVIYGDIPLPGTDGATEYTGVQLRLQDVDNASETGTPGDAQAGDSIVYNNVAELDGQPVSARLVLVEKSSNDLEVDLAFETTNEILLNGNNDGSQDGETATFRLEFFDPATGAAVVLDPAVVFSDLDNNVGVEIVSVGDGQIEAFGVAANSSLDVTFDGTTLTAGGTEDNANSDNGELDSQVAALFSSTSSITFVATSRGVNSGFNFAEYDESDYEFVAAEGGDDKIDGGDGNDEIYGQGGDDVIEGGDGDDTIAGGTGADELSGGADRDTFVADENASGSFIGDDVDGGSEGDDFDTLDLTGTVTPGGRLEIDITGPDSNGNGFDGTVTYFDENDNVLGTMEFREIEDIIPCFTPGTMIATPQGERRVEELREGDRVITRDNGIQEIRWIGQRSLDVEEVAENPEMSPILIKAGSLGRGLPERDLIVSPQHRVLIANDKTQLYFEENEVLVAAKHLVGLEGVSRMGTVATTYVHFMFDAHEVVLSNGAWTESFQPGDYTLGAMGDAARKEIFAIFPELQTEEGVADYATARRSLKSYEARLLHT